jgi:hypothetical protein
MMALLGILLCYQLVFGATNIRYDFSHNYDTQVDDLTASLNHGEKPAIGTATAVNTPYGLYLDGTTVKLPMNTYRTTNADIISRDDIAMSLFVRYLPGATGTFPRELITFKSSGGETRLQLRQQSANQSAAPKFELSVDFGSGATTITTGPLILSKWFFFAIRLESHSSDNDSDLYMCVNGGSTLTVHNNHKSTQDFTDNYLNGSNTKAIYYAYRFDDTDTDCSGFSSEFHTGGSYVLYEGRGVPCDTDSYTYDASCADCTTLCGVYGCVNLSISLCYNTSCPPGTVNDAFCLSCYANSQKTYGDNSCSCTTDYTQTDTNPLVCTSTCSTVAADYAANNCPSCYANSYNDVGAGTCTCDAGYFNSGAPSVVCTGKD